MDKQLLDILACPLCKGQLYYDRNAAEFICRIDRLAYPTNKGIPVMLIDQARQLPPDEEIPKG